MYRLYKDIGDRINELNTDPQNKRIYTIDIDNGQLQDPAQYREVTYPAVFIDIESVAWKDLTRGAQVADAAIIVVSVAFPLYSTSLIDAPETEINKIIDQFSIVDDVYKKLHGFNTDYSGSFTRTETNRFKTADQVKVFEMTFLVSGIDEKAMAEVTPAPKPSLQIEVKYDENFQ